MSEAETDLDILEGLIARARAAGAEGADALLVTSASLSHAQRLGKLERLEREESRDLGLRAFVGQRQAVVSTTDLSPKALEALVERAVAMARVVPEDPYCGLADPELLAREVPDVWSFDPEEPEPEHLIERARAAEEAARQVPGVTNSEGAEASWGTSCIALLGSNGFKGAYAVSRHSVSVSVLAGQGLEMERDYDFASSVFGSDLPPAEEIGRSAGERAVKRLKPRRPKTGRVPIVYDPRVANGLLRHFAGAISGSAIARGTSFLKDRLDQQVFAQGIEILDDPLRRRGLRSRPFDGEGLPSRRRALVEEGRLTGWLLDLASARQLALPPTGNAGRGVSGTPGPTSSNLYLAPGALDPEALMSDIESGFYVTEMLGMGVNGVTGDYSRGASGFWIEKGRLAWPVTEATIAGNLKEMYRNLTPANDLVFKYGTDSPTVRIEGMTVAGGG